MKKRVTVSFDIDVDQDFLDKQNLERYLGWCISTVTYGSGLRVDGDNCNLKLEKSIQEIIAQVEAAHFRTETDTGANPAAMVVWNTLREKAGLPWLSKKDLPAWCVKCKKYHVNPCEREPSEEMK